VREDKGTLDYFALSYTALIVVGTSEGQNQVKDEGQQQQPNTEYRCFPEYFGHPNAVNNANKQKN